MRKIVVYIATSADSYIARPDGDVVWLDRPRPKDNYGMDAFYKSVEPVLMGRKTYDLALKFGQESYPGKKNYVFSRTPHERRSASGGASSAPFDGAKPKGMRRANSS